MKGKISASCQKKLQRSNGTCKRMKMFFSTLLTRGLGKPERENNEPEEDQGKTSEVSYNFYSLIY